MTAPNRTLPGGAAIVAALGLSVAAGVLALSGCGIFGSPHPDPTGLVEIRVNWPGSGVAGASQSREVGVRAIPEGTDRLRVTITGDDMPTIRLEITRDEILAGSSVRRIAVPVGVGRVLLVEALDSEGHVIAAGKTSITVNAGVTARARVVLVLSSGVDPPPEVISRTLQLTGFSGDFVPIAKRPEDTESSELPLPTDAKSGTLTLDFFPELDATGKRPIVATFAIHNHYELWVVRGYVEAIPADTLDFTTGVLNDYVTDPGGYTTSFSGSLLTWDLLIGPILDSISGTGLIRIDFKGKDPLTTPEAEGQVDVQAGPSHTLVGTLDGELVF